MFKYPFNRYRFFDLKWRYWTIPKFKFQLFRRIKHINYCSWDMVESINEMLFAMFCHFWEENKTYYKELDKYNQDTEGWITFDRFDYLYKYIKYYRVNNKQTFETLEDKYFKSIHSEFIQCEDNEEYSTMKSTTLHYIKAKYKVDKDLRIFTVQSAEEVDVNIKRKPKNIIEYSNLYAIERQLNTWDNDIAKLIIDYREALWT